MSLPVVGLLTVCLAAASAQVDADADAEVAWPAISVHAEVGTAPIGFAVVDTPFEEPALWANLRGHVFADADGRWHWDGFLLVGTLVDTNLFSGLLLGLGGRGSVRIAWGLWTSLSLGAGYFGYQYDSPVYRSTAAGFERERGLQAHEGFLAIDLTVAYEFMSHYRAGIFYGAAAHTAALSPLLPRSFIGVSFEYRWD